MVNSSIKPLKIFRIRKTTTNRNLLSKIQMSYEGLRESERQEISVEKSEKSNKNFQIMRKSKLLKILNFKNLRIGKNSCRDSSNRQKKALKSTLSAWKSPKFVKKNLSRDWNITRESLKFSTAKFWSNSKCRNKSKRLLGLNIYAKTRLIKQPQLEATDLMIIEYWEIEKTHWLQRSCNTFLNLKYLSILLTKLNDILT